MKSLMIYFAAALLYLTGISWAGENVYVGSEVCKDCHEQEYANFTRYAKKASSFASIKKMKAKLTPEEYQSCFECHTTGYNQNGGFESEEKTPELADTGCEVCHGPGSLHVEDGDPELIAGTVTMETCTSCHDEEKVQAFGFKPLIYGGAH